MKHLTELIDKVLECIKIHQGLISDLAARVHELEKAEKKNKKWFS